MAVTTTNEKKKKQPRPLKTNNNWMRIKAKSEPLLDLNNNFCCCCLFILHSLILVVRLSLPFNKIPFSSLGKYYPKFHMHFVLHSSFVRYDEHAAKTFYLKEISLIRVVSPRFFLFILILLQFSCDGIH